MILDLTDVTWKPTGPEEFPEACLLAERIQVRFGVHCYWYHLEAVAVVWQEVDPESGDPAHRCSGKIQVAAHDDYEDWMPEAAIGELIRIGEHDYFLRLTPYLS